MKVPSQKSLLFLTVLALTVGHLQAATIDWQQQCYSKLDGTVFAIENDCTSYIYCLDQTPITLSCATNMGFSVTSRGCVNKLDSDCVEQTKNESDLTLTTDSSRETTRATCDNEIRPENQAACVGQAFGALVPYPGNCSQFLVCNCVNPTVIVCRDGLWFDPTIQTCNWPQDVDCDDSVGTITTTEVITTTTDANAWGKDCLAPEGMSADICLKYDNGFLLRYPYNCNAYVNCTMGCPVMNYCPDEKVFNGFLKICDTPDTAQCDELPLPVTTTTEEPTTTTEETTTTTEEPLTTTEEPSTTTEEPTTTPPADCIPLESIDTIICAGQLQGTFVPYPYNCTGYIVCKWECPYLEYCENGKLFNALLGICDSPSEVICEELPFPTTTTTESTTTTEITTSATPTLPTLPPDVNPDLCLLQQDNTIYPYEGDCSQYLQCQDGEVNVMTCPNGWLFNSQLMLCDQASEDVCYTGPTTTETTTTVTEEITTPGFELCIGQAANTTFPYTEDCSWYYFCTGDDKYLLISCPNNNYYDPYSGNCGPSETPDACKDSLTTTTTAATTLSPSQKCFDQSLGTSFPYEENCRQYIMCNGRGGFTIVNCPNNNYFYADSGTCGPSDDPYVCIIQTTTTTTVTTTTSSTTTTTTTETPTTTTTNKPPSLGICGNSSNGELIEYPDNCEKFIMCVLPIPIAFYCNENWYFDVDQQRCVPDTYGSCTGLPSNTTTVQPPTDICQGLGEGDWQIYASDCQLYYKCLGDGFYMLQTCNVGEFFDPLQGQCSSAVGSEYCKENFDSTTTTTTTAAPPRPTGICAQQPVGAVIAYPDNCFRFIVCDNPIPVGYSCPGDLQFSSEQQICVEAIDSDCGVITTSTEATPTPTIPYSLCTDKPNFSYLPYEEDCAMFILCINNVEHLAYCNNGQYFDVLQGDCMEGAKEDACRKQESTTTTEASTTTTTEVTTTTTEEPTTITTEASTTTTEDPNLGPCYNKPDGTKLPYPNNCEKYIECRDPLPVGFDCPDGLEFSATLRECVLPILADCSIKTTTEIPSTPTEPIPTTTPSTEETCDNKPNGFTLPYPEDCSRYYMCVNGNPRLTNCMPNTYYDPSSGQCDGNVSPTACQGTAASTTTTQVTTDTTITTTELTTPVTTTVPDPTTTPSSEETCDNKPNGFTLPYPEDCSRYYMCVNGNPRLTNCMPNTYYDPFSGQCDGNVSPTACQGTSATTTTTEITTDTTTTVKTTTEITTTTDLTTTIDASTTTTSQETEDPCNGQWDGYTFSYEEDCSRYYMCMNGSPILLRCLPNTFYNPLTGDCDDETSSTACKETDTTPITTTTTEVTTTITTDKPQSENICCGQINGTQLPYPGDQTKYVICLYPVPEVVQCPNNGKYDNITASCLTVKDYTTYAQPNCSQFNYGKVLTYEGDCTKYYLCFGGDATVLNCSNNWYFSAILGQCVPKELYSCPW